MNNKNRFLSLIVSATIIFTSCFIFVAVKFEKFDPVFLLGILFIWGVWEYAKDMID